MEYEITDIYSDVPSNKQRYEDLKAFAKAKNLTISKFARSPGRVNIISEHTDYHNYQVSPIALENDFIFAICLSDGPKTVELLHLDPKLYVDQFDYTQKPESIAKPNNEWTMYVRAGFHAAATYAQQKGISLANSYENKHLTLIGTGNVPLGSGLSSSSALTCCSALAFLAFASQPINKTELAAIDAKSEALVAIEGGGMDQAISLNGERGKISVINFYPKLNVQQYNFIPGVKIACLNSLKDSKKANSAANFYNQRVAEGRAGNAILLQEYRRANGDKDFSYWRDYAEKMGLDRKIDVGLDLQKLYQCSSPDQMLGKVEGLPEQLTIKQLMGILGYPDFQTILHDLFKTKIAGNCLFGKYETIEDSQELIIRKRLRHVFSEAYRAQQFEKVLKDDSLSRDMKLSQITEFVNDSGKSCDEDYECSCPELREVILKSRQSGAFAARLTGAGLGGFAVALVHDEDCQQFLESMKGYYASKGRTDMENCCFITGCGMGGCFVKNDM